MRAFRSFIVLPALLFSFLTVAGSGFLPGIICGHLARSECRRNPALTGSGIALAGLIVGYIFVGVTVLTLLAASGCLPTGVPSIRGGTSEPLGIGRLATLQLVNPDGKVTVVVLYPAPIDPSWYPTFGQSGNGGDISKWQAIFPIAYQGVSGTETITVQWEYSARTQKLRIGDAQVDLPKGKVGVISFDDKMKPSCEVLDKLPKAVELAKQKADREATEVEPTVEAG